MSKKKHKGSPQKSIAQSAAAHRSNGFSAFQKGDYDRALIAWEKLPKEARPLAALAEAYFRRGLAALYRPNPHSRAGLADLLKAHQYQPADGCYALHLGLAAHHQGDLLAAVEAYRAASKTGGDYAHRAAYPLALALLQQGQDPAGDPVWSTLTTAEQTLVQTAGVFRRRPYRLPPTAPRLLQALAALDAGDSTAARTGLQETLLSAHAPMDKGIANYYLGVLTAQNGDWDEARRCWMAAHAAGLRSARLHENLGEALHRLAEQALGEGDASTALLAAQEATRHKTADTSLNELLAQAHQILGYQAASANDWEQAQQHWRTAVELDADSYRLAYNLALSYEQSNQYLAAGEAWRNALRRRPRRSDHPDAIDDTQVARLWQRAAECYTKGSNFEEANRVYQQAVKWAPDNLDLRMALAESLLKEGRLTAASNELNRILERDPEHVPALLRLGETYFRNEDQWWMKAQAKRYWEQALALQPDNPQVRQALAEWYLDRAEIDYSWEHYEKAIQNYQKALEFQPDHATTLAYLAECYFELGNQAQGNEYLHLALAHAADFGDFADIVDVLLRVEEDEPAWDALLQAEARFGKVPTDFYVAMAHNLLEDKRQAQATIWLERVIEKAVPEDNIYLMIGEMAMEVDQALSRQYLHKAIEAGQMPGQAYLILAGVEHKAGNDRAGKKYLEQAERIARQTKDRELQERIELARVLAGGPQAFLDLLYERGGPQMVEDFLKGMKNMDFDDE
jgi:tetratricopeptide (TPR) repeat protein